jgi:integrase
MGARGRPAKQDYPLTDRIGRVEIRKRTAGSAWQARYSTPLGRQEHSLKLRSMDSARHEAARIDQLLECGDYEILTEERATPNLTFAEFVAQELLPKYRGWGDGTRRTAGSYLNSLNKTFGSKLLTAITPRMIEGYLARRRDDPDKPLSKATRNRHLACLKTLFKAAVDWNFASTNPAERVKMEKERQRVPDALSEEEVARLTGHLAEHLRPVVVFAVDTGMRAAKVFGLTWADVDLEITWEDPAGNVKKGLVTVRAPKNDEDRVIPMTDRVYQTLVRQRELNARSDTPSMRVFPYEADYVNKRLIRAAGEVGIEKHVTMHVFRHTWATRLRDRGVPLDRIKELGGWKTMRMVERYAKMRNPQLQAAIAALNG